MKKITLLLAFFICLNISLNAQTYPKKENVIRLLTYNTHYCKGGSDPGSIDDYNTQRLASVIEAFTGFRITATRPPASTAAARTSLEQ